MASASPFAQFVQQLPKVELHLHLETSLRLRRLALRLGSGQAGRQQQASVAADHSASHAPNPFISGPHLVADPARFTGYDRLRRLRYASRVGQIADGLYTPENIEAIAYELLEEAAAHRLRYVEIRVGGRRGFTLLGTRQMLEAMASARARAEATPGIRSGFIITIVRERGPDEAEQRVRDAMACRDCGVVGVDLAGDEQNYPPALFSRALGLAREAGLGVTVHAGEFSGPASIWTAMYQLGAHRIGHGIRAVEDPELLTYLREHHITLEICPTSNVRLGLCSSLSAHPLKQLLDRHVPVTVNSDDPLLLGTNITRELEAVAQACALSGPHLTQMMVTAAQATFLPSDERDRLANDIAPQD